LVYRGVGLGRYDTGKTVRLLPERCKPGRLNCVTPARLKAQMRLSPETR